MVNVEMKTSVNASAQDVWQVVGDFSKLHKFVAAVSECVADSSEVGAQRTLTLQDGALLVERLESIDHDAKTLEYSIVSGPLPVANYRSKMEVREAGTEKCEVHWSSSFDASGASEEEAKGIIEGVYSMGFSGLKEIFG